MSGFPVFWPSIRNAKVPTCIENVYIDRDCASTVNVFPAAGTTNTNYTVTAGGRNSPVYPVTINTWYRNNPLTLAANDDTLQASNEIAGFTAFELSGASAPVAVTFNDRIVTSAKVYPARHAITPTISGDNTVNFNVTRPGKYIVMINDTEVRPCHVFVHPVDTTAPTASGPGVVYYGRGTHNIGTVTVDNNTTYYIAGGARVIGQFAIDGKTGFKIKGRGVVQSSSNFIRGDGASNFTIEGLTIVRPLGTTGDWTFKPRNCTGFTVDGCNVFSCEVVRDGVDSVSCRDYTIKNCFVRTVDDPCCINAAFAGLGSIENFTIQDCVLMPDNGIGGLEIGASMECAYCRNGVYRRIDMVNPRIRSAISIFNGDYCDVYNLLYDDIHVDGFQGSSPSISKCVRLDCTENAFSAQPWSPGRIREIDFYNVTFVNTAPSLVRQFLYEGADATHLLENIRWHNLRCDGVLITDESQLKISKNAFVANITYDTRSAA